MKGPPELHRRRTTLLFLEAGEEVLVRRQEAARRLLHPQVIEGGGLAAQPVEQPSALLPTPTRSSTPAVSTCTSSPTPL